MAGEVGHTCIDYQGLPCPCGRRGCWEQYASASALKRFTAQALQGNPDSILARVIQEHDGHVSGQSAFMAARAGDPVGRQVCDMYIGYLAAGIANVVNIFQPDTLAIGGGVSNESDEQLLHPLQRLVEQETIPCSSDKKTRIVKAQLGNQAGIIGRCAAGQEETDMREDAMQWYERLDEKLRDYLPDMTVEHDVPMSRHTSFRIGGPARRMAFPESREQLVILLGLAEECGVQPFLLGRGTNLLVSDRGLDTLVIKTAERMTGIRRLDDVTLEADAGVLLSRLAVYAQQAGLTGWNLPTASPAVWGARCA